VEIAIVLVLREVIVNGVLENDWQQILAVLPVPSHGGAADGGARLAAA
jgi:hypothetical protein